jgi:hypothetical protein
LTRAFGQFGVEQGVEQGLLQSAGGLDHEAGDGRPGQGLDDPADARGVIGDGEDLVGIGASQIQRVLGDVDADEDGDNRLRKNGLRRCVGHACGPFLRMRA